ncbi:MAG TPA: RagB/SusD family nutrient uptake outer membrane protein [Gemmatimonadaceae bacterium]|nr:RagB/SusD family nutrient uptake outer membrane protein [Gemmatimonadaceae bacterium]
MGVFLLCAAAPIAISACTDLTEVPKDALTPTNAFGNEVEVLAGVASVYANLRTTMDDRYNLAEVSTDEIIVPTRGQDWYDNGRWLEIYKHNWNPNSGAALGDMNGAWNNLFAGVARANLMIEIVSNAGGPNSAAILAELRTLRAWYYYLLMDFFGGVPVVTTRAVEATARASRDSVFKFIEAELKATRAVLPATRPASEAGRVTKGAANAILASLYLNAQVYSGTVAAGGLTKGTARWQDAINAADSVINSGQYTLEPNWKKNFAPDNDDSKENIFYIANTDAQPDLGMNFPHRTLHYNQLNVQGGPWNGFATIAETYNAFNPADKRREIFLVGQQFSFDNNLPVKDRAGNSLVFSVNIGDETKAAENEGPRYNKFTPKPGVPSGSSQPNNFPFFRLAEMYLIKAEALNELNQPGPAIAQVNIIRERQFSPPNPLPVMSQAATRDAIFAERLFELTGEGKRRSDMVRAGTYINARRFKTASAPYKVLFPIPQTQIASNPLLTQNPGY